MPLLTRRQLLKAAASIVAGGAVTSKEAPAVSPRGAEANMAEGIPLLHITDLYHPPQDPDDQLDLATIMALHEFDLKGVVLDITQRFLEGAPAGFDIPRDPGFVPAVQLGYLAGRAFPIAMGPTQPLNDPRDDARSRPRQEQAGIDLVLEVLRRSSEPVVLSLVGSARVLMVAYNRDPDLVRARTRAVVLNAGSTGTHREWNVDLDTAAYVGLWRSGLPLHWYPCATERGAFNPDHERGTYWSAAHADLFRDLPNPLRAWFAYGYAGSARGDVIRALSEHGRGAVWEHILTGSRNIWATASLVMAAGRVLAKTHQGWRFVPEEEAAGLERWPWRLDSIEASVDDQGQVRWQPTEKERHTLLFGRRRGAAYGMAMTEALQALLSAMPVG